jgi:hypothetical protein
VVAAALIFQMQAEFNQLVEDRADQVVEDHPIMQEALALRAKDLLELLQAVVVVVPEPLAVQTVPEMSAVPVVLDYNLVSPAQLHFMQAVEVVQEQLKVKVVQAVVAAEEKAEEQQMLPILLPQAQLTQAVAVVLEHRAMLCKAVLVDQELSSFDILMR